MGEIAQLNIFQVSPRCGDDGGEETVEPSDPNGSGLAQAPHRTQITGPLPGTEWEDLFPDAA